MAVTAAHAHILELEVPSRGVHRVKGWAGQHNSCEIKQGTRNIQSWRGWSEVHAVLLAANSIWCPSVDSVITNRCPLILWTVQLQFLLNSTYRGTMSKPWMVHATIPDTLASSPLQMIVVGELLPYGYVTHGKDADRSFPIY